MARPTRARIAYLKQRRQGVAEIKLKELNREAHRRAAPVRQQNLLRIYKDIYGLPDDITVDLDRVCRILQGLEEGDRETPREQILRRVSLLKDRTELVFHFGTRRMFLIREDDKTYYFLYRDKGSYYKKSIRYPSRTRAMEKYQEEKISWVAFFSEQN